MKSLASQAYAFLLAKKDFRAALEFDPSEEKTKTAKMRETMEKLQSLDAFLVFDRRTGDLATPDWTKKYVTADANGVPQLRNQSSRARIWVMTLRMKFEDVNIDLSLRSKPDGVFQAVRCWDLQDGRARSRYAPLMRGYHHLFNEVESDEATLIGIRLSLLNMEHWKAFSVVSFSIGSIENTNATYYTSCTVLY